MFVQIITLFPDMFPAVIETSMLRKARELGILEVNLVNLREFGLGRHQSVDDKPYGGGSGMILRADVLVPAIEQAKEKAEQKIGHDVPVILLSPQGQTYQQTKARQLAGLDGFILVCGHYEGFDERIRELAVDEELSIGDYVLTGGEIPAMAVLDSVARLLPGVLASDEAHQDETFEGGLVEYPQYTRPEEYEGKKVPPVLLSGHHGEVARWRQQQKLAQTRTKRPDLLER